MSPLIRTDRLLLRRFVRSDLDALCRLYADWEIRRYFPDGVLSRAQTEEELVWSMEGVDALHPDIRLYAAIDRQSGALIGRGGFVPWRSEQTTEVEIAYLLDRKAWRRGLGTEMAGALLGHGFAALGLERLIAVIDPANVASIRTAEKLGMRLDRALEFDGKPYRVFALSAQDFGPGSSAPSSP